MSFRSRLWAVAYNVDRAVASAFGAPPQVTISAVAARACQAGKWWGKALCWGLDLIDPGHCAASDKHAEKLEAVDTGEEK